uniref:Uncharacterized protein n=1 Tax=Helianthus annuus TaxID=4232 RepID=A0A251VGG4_HELAN
MNLCKSVLSCKIVFKTSRSTYVQVWYIRRTGCRENHVFIKVDKVLTNTISINYKCRNTCRIKDPTK